MGYSPWGHKELDKTEQLTTVCWDPQTFLNRGDGHFAASGCADTSREGCLGTRRPSGIPGVSKEPL